MKIDFGAVLMDFKTKEPLKLNPENDKVVTLGFISVEALLAEIQEKPRNGNQKLEAYNLATKIHNETVVEITVTQASGLKDRIGEVYGPIIVGQCWPLLDDNKSE